jgi:hypothetical protein
MSIPVYIKNFFPYSQSEPDRLDLIQKWNNDIYAMRKLEENLRPYLDQKTTIKHRGTALDFHATCIIQEKPVEECEQLISEMRGLTLDMVKEADQNRQDQELRYHSGIVEYLEMIQ